MKEQTRVVVTMSAFSLLWCVIFFAGLIAMVKIGDVRDDIRSLAVTIESTPSSFADIKIKPPDHGPNCTCHQDSDIALTDFVEALHAKGESSLGWMLLWANSWGVPLMIMIVWASAKYGRTANAAFPHLSQKEAMQYINKSVTKTLLCPAGIGILALPFLLLAIFHFIGQHVELTPTHGVIFTVVTTLLVFVGIIWLTVTRGARIKAAMEKEIQQQAGQVSSESAPSASSDKLSS